MITLGHKVLIGGAIFEHCYPNPWSAKMSKHDLVILEDGVVCTNKYYAMWLMISRVMIADCWQSG